MKLPGSLEEIGAYAFANCTALSDIYLPENLNKLGSSSFYNCKGLTGSLDDLGFPAKVKAIPSGCFSGCSGLTGELTIPDDIKLIGGAAFANCSGVEKITIPVDYRYASDNYAPFSGCSGVKEISYTKGKTGIMPDVNETSSSSTHSYYNNRLEYSVRESIESVEFKEGVKRVGANAFYYYYSSASIYTSPKLESVKLPGSLEEIGAYAFANCESLVSINILDRVNSIADLAFYNHGDSLVIYGYADSYAEDYADKHKIKFELYDNRYKESVPKGKYGIFVVDSKGKAIKGATVEFGEYTELTDSKGLALFYTVTTGTPVIKVSCNGYTPYSNVGTNYSKNSNHYDIVTLYRPSDGALRLKSAVYKTTIGNESNLLNRAKKVYKSYNVLGVEGSFSVICEANDTNAASKYELWQNHRCMAVSDNGKFENLNPSDFKNGKGVFVKVYNSDGKSVTTHINLEFADSVDVKSEMEIGEDVSFTIGKDVPLLGGRSVNLSMMKKLPVKVKISGDTCYFGINIGDFEETSIDDLKKSGQTLKKLSEAKENNQTAEAFEKLFAEEKKGISNSIDTAFIGYGECKLGSDGLPDSEVTMYIAVRATGKLSKEWGFMVSVVPVTVNLDLSLKAEIGSRVKADLSTGTFTGDVVLKATPKVQFYMGVGAGKIASAGGYASGEVEAETIIAGPSPHGLTYADITLEGGLKAYLLNNEFKYVLAKKKYNLYTRTVSENTLSLMSMSAFDVYSSDNYGLQDLSYIAGKSEWFGNTASVQSRSRGISQSSEIKNLITTAYENSTPSVVSDGETMIMAYLDADTSRGANNATVVKYSIYDESTGTWGEPVKLDSNDTADYQPQLYLIGQDIYLTYQDCSNVYGDNDNIPIGELVKQQNIRTAKFNTQTRRFEIVNTVDAADKYRSCQTAGTMNENAVTAWVENSGSDIFNQNDTNEIWYSTYDGTSWNTPEKEITGAKCVTALAVTESGIAYVSDTDMNLNTDGDKVLYIGENVLDSGNISGLKVCDGIMMWVNDGILKKYNENTVSTVFDDISIPGEFVLAGNTLYYTVAGEGCSNIYGRKYDAASESWSESVRITSGDRYIEYLSAAELNGTLYAAFTDTKVTITTTTAGNEEINDIIRECNLSWCRLEEVTDLTAEDAEYDSEAVAPGSQVPVSVTVRNSGSSAIGTADVVVTDENGSTVYESTVNMGLAAGASKQIEVPVKMGETISEHTYSISVNVDGDRNPDDNSIEAVIGYTDFELECEQVQVGDVISLYMTVTNRSHAASSGRLEITCGDKCTYTADVPVLEYGESSTSVANLSEIALSDGSSGQIRVEAVADAAEDETYNNYEIVYLDLDYDITYYAQAGDETPFKVQSRSYDEYAEIIEDKPVREDYRLVGWSTDSEAKVAEYTAGDSISSNRNLTLYGVWQERTDYTVKGSITSYSDENAVVKVYPKDTVSKDILHIDDDGNVSLDDDIVLPYEVNVETPEADGDTYIQAYSVAVDAGEYAIAVYIPGYGLHIEDVDRNNRNKDISLYLLGDANGDGKVRIGDKAVLARYIAEWKGYDKLLNEEAADINGDGEINAADRMLLERHLAGWSRYKVLEYGMNTKKQ